MPNTWYQIWEYDCYFGVIWPYLSITGVIINTTPLPCPPPEIEPHPFIYFYRNASTWPPGDGAVLQICLMRALD